MWSLTAVLLGCIVLGADAYTEELGRRILEAGDCIRMLVECNHMYEHIAHNEINGSIFYDIKDLERACENNKDYVKCVDRTKLFCEKRNMNEMETSMIKRRLWMRDLCAPNSDWKKVYDKKGVCIIQATHRASRACSRTLTPPADSASLTLDELCGFFVGMVKCLSEVLSKRCGIDASDLFIHISYYHGAGDYLCVDKEKGQQWPIPRSAKQVFRTVEGLMANITPIIRATSTQEKAATVLQDLNPQEVQKIKDAFKSVDGIVDEEGLEFEVKIPIHDEDDDTFLNREDLEYNMQATKEKVQNDDLEYPEQSLNSDELLQVRPIDNTIDGNPEDHVDWSDPDMYPQSHSLGTDDQAESMLAEPDEPQVDKSEDVDYRSNMDSGKRNIWQDSKHEDICEYVATFHPSVLPEPPESYKNCELDDFCSLENIAALYPKESIQKRSLLLQEDNEASDSIDRNLSLVFSEEFELPEHINDVEESLLHQEMSEPSRKYQDPHCEMPESFEDSSNHFTESVIPQEIYFPEYSDTTTYSEDGNIPNMINPTDCKTGSIQNIVSSTIKPGIYAEVTSLQTVHPPNFKFGKGCQFAENVNYIVVGEPYYPAASPLMASYTIPYEYEVKPSSALLDAEQFIKHGIDSILTEPMGESQE